MRKTLKQRIKKLKRYGNNGLILITSVAIGLMPIITSMQAKSAQANKSTASERAQMAALYEWDQYRVAADKLGDVQVADLTKLSLNSALRAKLSNVVFNGGNAVTIKDGYEIDAKIPKISGAKQVNFFFSKTGETGLGRVSFLSFSDKRELLKDKNVATPSFGAYIRSTSSDSNASNLISNVGTSMKQSMTLGDISSANNSLSGALGNAGGVGSWFIVSFPEKTMVNMLKLRNSSTGTPNKTVALDFSDGTTVTADLNRSDSTIIQFPDVYTKEIRVRVLSAYSSDTAYENTSTDHSILAFIANPVQKFLESQSLVPSAFASDTLSTGAYSSNQIMSAFVNERSSLLKQASTLQALSRVYADAMRDATTLGLSTTSIQKTLDPITLLNGTTMYGSGGANGTQFSVSSMYKERLLIDYAESIVKTMERYTSGGTPQSTINYVVGNLVNNGLAPSVSQSYLSAVVSTTGRPLPWDVSGLLNIKIFASEIDSLKSLYASRVSQLAYMVTQKTIDSASSQADFFIKKIGTLNSSGAVEATYSIGTAIVGTIPDYTVGTDNVGASKRTALLGSLSRARTQRLQYITDMAGSSTSRSTVGTSGSGAMADSFSGQSLLDKQSQISSIVSLSFLSGGIMNSSGLINTNTTLGALLTNPVAQTVSGLSSIDGLAGSTRQTAIINRFASEIANSPFIGTLPTSITYGDSFSRSDIATAIADNTAYPSIPSLGAIVKPGWAAGFSEFEVYDATSMLRVKDSSGNIIGADLGNEIRLFLDNTKGEALSPAESANAVYSAYSKKVSLPLSPSNESKIQLFALSGDISFLVEVEDSTGIKTPIIINGTSGVNLKDGWVSATSVLLKKVQADKKDYTVKVGNVFQK